MKINNEYRQQNIEQVKLQQIKTPQQNKQNSQNFGGAGDMFLRFLDTNQAWGANAVDLFCMDFPRAYTDFKDRGFNAGCETSIREGMGTANHSSIGLYGTLAGMALATAINSAYGLGKDDIKAHLIFADAETVDLQGKIYSEKLKSNVENPIKEYLKETLSRYEALSSKNGGSWQALTNEEIEKTASILEQEIRKNTKKMDKEACNTAKNTIISGLGAEKNIRVAKKDGEVFKDTRYTADYVIENLYKLGKVFNKEKVIDAFKNAQDVDTNAFLKSLKTMNVKRSLIGTAIATAIGCATQPINMYLTKRKTGSEEFVGGGEKDNSFAFKVRKGIASLLFTGGVLATIGNPKNIIQDLQFKGLSPTIKQFKFIYGMTIVSRFIASRNDNELRESVIKDVLGFANWLILGNFVQKLVAQGLDKSLVKTDGKGFLNWIKNSALKSRDEVVHEALGKEVFGADGKALSYKEMVKKLPKGSDAIKKLRILSAAQIVGYLYSAFILGSGIPKLNIAITNKFEAEKAKAQEQAKLEKDALGV